MWLDEHDAKQLLSRYGVSSPDGDVARDPAEAVAIATAIGRPAYVKALISGKDRAARGGVQRIEGPASADRAFNEVTGALGATAARVEAACEVRKEWFVAVGLLPGDDRPSLLFSEHGGMGVEERRGGVARIEVDIALGLQPFHSRQLAATAKLASAERPLLQQVATSCYEVLVDCDATLVEINPLAITAGGVLALDAHVVVDDYALFRHEEFWTTRSGRRESGGLSAELRRDGIEFIPFGGTIGIIGLGAGLTMHLADWIVDVGGTPAFFFDATAAAVRDWAPMFAGETPNQFASALARGLSRVGGQTDALLVNFTSGGTPVDALVKGLFLALEAVHWTRPLIVHVAGNRQEAAARLLRQAGIEPFARLGDAVRAAVRAAGEVS
jgi:succinyl-CoA synthetase beta subunit